MLLNPIFTTILGLLLRYEKPQYLKTIGLICSILGTVGLIVMKSSTTSTPPEMIILPTFFLFISSLCNAWAVIIWKKLLVDYKLSPLIVSTWSLVVGSLFMFTAFMIKPYWFPWKEVQPLSTQLHGCGKILSCCFIIMLGYAITYSILTWATHKSSISIVALYASARPLFTVILSFIINTQDMWITFASVSLLVLVLFGLILSSHSKRVEKKARIDAKKQETKARLRSEFKRIPVGPMSTYDTPPKFLQIT